MKLSRIFQKAVLSTALIAGAGYGGYVVGDEAYQYMATTPMPALRDDAQARATTYHQRLTTLAHAQKALTLTTDEEDAGHVLFEAKRSFATDAILDTALAEADLAVIARTFNTISGDDGIRFRSFEYDPATIARRNECLHVTPATDATWGNDRFAYAQRVETCMIRMTDDTGATNTIAARLGGVAGGGMAFAFLLGRVSRRRTVAPKAN